MRSGRTYVWCFEDETTDATDTVLVAERRHRISEAKVARFLDLLTQLPIRVDEAPLDLTAILAAGRRHELSACDAAYVALAERLGLPLATVDAKLSAACRDAGVDLLIA